MEDKKLNEKESLELISRMIRNTQNRMVQRSGVPFLIFGYLTVIVSLLVWYFLTTTHNGQWNYLWFLIPVIGFPAVISVKKREKPVKTFVDKVIQYVWFVLGITGFSVSMVSMFYWSIPILFIIILLMGAGTAITGLIIQFKPIVFSGFLGLLLSYSCLVVTGTDRILIFATVFLVMMVIPGHILNYKSRKSNV